MSMPTVLLANRMLWSKQQPRCTSRTFRGVHKTRQEINVQYYTILTTTPLEYRREKLQYFVFWSAYLSALYNIIITLSVHVVVSPVRVQPMHPPPPALPPTVHAPNRPVLHTGDRCTDAKKMEKCECDTWIFLSCEEATV